MVKVKNVTSKIAKKSVAVVKKEANKVKKTAKLSKIKKTAKETTRKVKKRIIPTKKEKREIKLKNECEDRGVVYLKHIPHGFYEKEMYDYFRQFGKVTAIKLPRSKNGKSRGYAFIEFEYKEIAKIVADTMNNYLMFDKLLQTEYIPPEKQKPHLFHRNSMPWDDTSHKDAADQRRELDRTNKNKPILDTAAFVKKTQETVKKMHATLMKKTGIDYEIQINDAGKDKVQLVSVKRKSIETTPSKNAIKQKTTPTPKRRKLLNDSLNETDNNIKIKPPPNKVKKLLKTSKSKLKIAANKTEDAIVKLKGKAVINKKVKNVKSKVKNKAKQVVKNGKSKISKKVVNSKKKVDKQKNKVGSIKSGKFTKQVAKKSIKKMSK